MSDNVNNNIGEPQNQQINPQQQYKNPLSKLSSNTSPAGFFTKKSNNKQQLSPRIVGGAGEQIPQSVPTNNLMQALANANQSYASGLSIEEFKDELNSSCPTFEDKFNLLRAQFQTNQDPLLFDFYGAAHQSVSLTQTAAMTTLVSNLSQTHIQMIVALFENIQRTLLEVDDVRTGHQQEVLMYLPQVQSLLSLLSAKVLSITNFTDFLITSQENSQPYKTLNHWIPLLSNSYSTQLRPGFLERLLLRLTELLTHILNYHELHGNESPYPSERLRYLTPLLTLVLQSPRLIEQCALQLVLPTLKFAQAYPTLSQSVLWALAPSIQKKKPSNSTQGLVRGEKALQLVIRLMHRQIYLAIQNELPKHSQDADEALMDEGSPQKDSNPVKVYGKLSEYTRNEFITPGIFTSEEVNYLNMDQREDQLKWVDLSQALLQISVEIFKNQSNQTQGALNHQLTIIGSTLIDLFKVTTHMICQHYLHNNEEHFNDSKEPLLKQFNDIVERQNTECLLIQTYQSVFECAKSNNSNAFSFFFTNFETLLQNFLSDTNIESSSYHLSIYLVFLDKLCTSFIFSAEMFEKDTQNKLLQNLLQAYLNLSCPLESRIKDIENNDYLKNRQVYNTLLNKFRQLEERSALIHDGKIFSAAQILNRAQSQQLCFELINYFSHFKEKNSELCMKFINHELGLIKDDYSKSYSLLKLAIQVMSRGEGGGNKGYYEILVHGFQYPLTQGSNNDQGQTDHRQTEVNSQNEALIKWQLVENFKSSITFDMLWQAICKKIRLHLIAKVKILREKSMISQNPSSSRAENIINKQQSPSEEGLLQDQTFNIFKRLYIFATMNLEMFNIIYPTIKEISRDVKDFEHSFELKLAIHSMLVICKDKEHDKHKDVLKSLINLLKYLYDYISMVDVKYGNQKPPGQINISSGQSSSSRRHQDGELSNWELERISKVKQIKQFVGQAVSIIESYIDFKEKRLPSNLAFLEGTDEATRSSQPRQLAMMTNRKEYFDQVLIQLKKIILRSHMHGGYLVEQLLRVFFYEKRELQNLCLINKTTSNEYLVDQNSKSILESILGFIVEATDNMQGNACSLVRNFVQNLYNFFVTHSGTQQLNQIRFAKNLNTQAIKNIRKIMIFIREKYDQLQSTCIQFKEVLVAILAKFPNQPLYKEFFTFFRDIFYYNQDMDQVDFSLACDNMEILNQLIQSPTQQAVLKEQVSIKQQTLLDKIQLTDYFMFSNLAPGIILNETFKVPQESFTITLLFKINVQQIQALQERTGKQDLQLTFFQIIDKSGSIDYPPLQIIIHVLKDRLKIYDFDQKLDDNWHFLTVLFDFNRKTVGKNFHKIKIFIDTLTKRINQDRHLQHTFHKSHEHIFSYGVDALDMMANAVPFRPGTTQIASQNVSMQLSQLQPFVLNNDFKPNSNFEGVMSLPFMFTKFEVDKQTETQKRAIMEFLIESIVRKQIVGVSSYELTQYLRWRGKIQSKDTLPPFETHEFTEDVILKHQKAVQIDHLGAIHLVQPHEQLVVIGGFKVLYPIFEKSLQSNLSSLQKSEIWRHLFKILKTYMNTDPSHVLRLFKHKFLLPTLKSNLIRAGNQSATLLTTDLLQDFLSLARDIHSNPHSELLEEFYRKLVFDVILDETFCDLICVEPPSQGRVGGGRRRMVFEYVCQFMQDMYNEEDAQREKFERISSKIISGVERRQRKASDQPTNHGYKEFFNMGNARDIYKLLMKLIVRYPESEYIKHTKKLAMIMMKIILRDQQKENFSKLLEGLQQTQDNQLSRRQTRRDYQMNLQIGSKATLLVFLRIFEGVIKHSMFNLLPELCSVLKSQYIRERMEQHLNQTQSYNIGGEIGEYGSGRLEDEIIAITVRIIIEVQNKLSEQPKQVLPPRHMYIGVDKLVTSYHEERVHSINQLYRCLVQNPKDIYLHKTLCSLLITCYLKQHPRARDPTSAYTLLPLKYNFTYLKNCIQAQNRDLNQMLESMRGGNNHLDFDHDLFGITIKLFRWYDSDTKKSYLEYFKHLIEEQCMSHNIEEIETFKDINFLERIRVLLDTQLETYLLNIIALGLKSQDPEIVIYGQYIAQALIKGLFNTSLQMDIEGIVYEEELRYFKFVKKIVLLFEAYDQQLLLVLTDVLKYLQSVVNWVWSYVLHDTNRTNLNLKLLLFLQLIEELFITRLAHPDNQRVQYFLQNPLTQELLARLMIIFDDTRGLLYFDYPNPNIIETNKRNTIVTGIIRTKESFAMREVSFTIGGPVRAFFSMFMQVIRKMKPVKVYENQVNAPFDLTMELFRYYLFKEESPYVASLRPVPTIEPPTPNAAAPLFKIMFNSPFTKKSQQYVLQPIDLTRQFIESFNELTPFYTLTPQSSQDSTVSKESITQTLGFLPILLLTEFHELLKRKYAHLSQAADAHVSCGYQEQVMQVVKALKQVIRECYISEEIPESVGYVLLTITDPRLKEELYTSLNPMKLMQRGRLGASAKPYFLSKACEFIDQIRQNTEIGTRQMGSEVEAPDHNLYGRGLQTVMRDGHFRQSGYPNNITPEGGAYIDVQRAQQEKIEELQKQEDADDADEQLFNDAELDPIRKAEEKERLDTGKDYTLYQEELILYMNKCHQLLTNDPDTTPLPQEDFLLRYRDEFLSIPRVEEIMQALRMISSEKFRHTHSYSFTQREESELRRQLKAFQALDQHIPHVANLISNNTNNNASIPQQMDSARSHKPIIQNQVSSGMEVNSPEKPPLRVLDSEGNQNFTPFIMMESQEGTMPIGKNANARKRSADDTSDNPGAFEFQSSGDPTNQVYSQTNSQGKFSLASGSSRPPLDSLSARAAKPPSRKHRTLEYYYSKQQYRKIVKRLMEEPASLWFDNLEQMRKDYQDMKEVYDIVNAMHTTSTATGESGAQQQQQSNNGYKPRQYDHFVKLRKSTDLWGRALLLKPDRNYKHRKFLISHKYFVHETLKNLFAVSLLDDSDFPDFQQQQQQLLEALERQDSNQQQEQKEAAASEGATENPQEAEKATAKKQQSEQFKRLRELLIQKIEQNDFLYSLLSDPEAFMNHNARQDFTFNAPQDQTIIFSKPCQYITVDGGIFGELYLSGQYLMFKSKPCKVDPSEKFALHLGQVIKKLNKVWHVSQLQEVFKRRFALMHQAFEIFTRDKKSYFFNLLNEESCRDFFSKMQDVARKHNKQDKSKAIALVEKPKHDFKHKHFVDEWLKGERTTQEFLLLVNKYSGRTFNDFSQYPVFPWVLSDYTSSYVELQQKLEGKADESALRDMTKNSGVLSPMKLEIAQTSFNTPIEVDTVYGRQPFHLKFGFSNRLFSLGYLIRMEPFTDNFIDVNGGLDNPDRIFYSFKDQWRSVYEDKQNNAELTPEFFYLPEMFRNHNLAYLGKSRTGQSVNEVELPSWARNEHDFIRIHREVIESKQVQSKLRYWIDLMFGSRQMDESSHNVFYCYAYESYVRPRRDELEDHQVSTILEFLQVPQQIFTEPLYKIDKKQMAAAMMHSQALQNIEEEPAEFEENSQMMEMQSTTPLQGAAARNARKGMVSVVQARQNKLGNKLSNISAQKALNSRTLQKDFDEIKAQPTSSGQQDLRNSSLIQKFLDCAASQNRQRHENDLKKIQESHKLDKPDDRNIFHMAFSQLNGRCFVFLADKETSLIRCVACRESFLQEELKNPCNLGLRLINLRGDFNNIFQLYGGGSQQMGGGAGSNQRQPLLFTCQNMDNSIRVYDLSVKKGGSQMVYAERSHRNMVTAIKFSSDFRYLISGDADGVIHHYQRITDESQNEQQDNTASLLQPGGAGNPNAIPQATPAQNDNHQPFFPFTLKYSFHDHPSAILAIDTNLVLDLYCMASRDGTLTLRCLRSSELWRVIQLEKLSGDSAEVLTLKLSRHGYIILMMKEGGMVYTFVYSLNGDLLVSTKREGDMFELKYAQLTEREDQLIMVFNQRIRKEDKDMQGVIRVCRLFDLEKEAKKDNLQRTFYPMIHNIIYGIEKNIRDATLRRTQITGDLNAMPTPSKYTMPSVLSFALSQDESKMNMFLRTGEIICFDESRSQIIEQLDDFGLA